MNPIVTFIRYAPLSGATQPSLNFIQNFKKNQLKKMPYFLIDEPIRHLIKFH